MRYDKVCGSVQVDAFRLICGIAEGIAGARCVYLEGRKFDPFICQKQKWTMATCFIQIRIETLRRSLSRVAVYADFS